VRVAPVDVGNRIDLVGETLVAGGDAIARIDGFPVFVPGLFPGDEATVDIVEVRKGFARGEVVTLRSASPGRRVVPCPVAGECGGCDWPELRLDRQLDAKRDILADSLRRTGRLAPEALPTIRIHASPLNYRLRSRLHRDGETGEIGFFARRSHRVVPLPDDCEVVGATTLSNMPRVRSLVTRGDTVDLFESDDELVVVERDEAVASETEVALVVGRWRYVLSTGSFFQVNRHLLARLVDLVVSIARGADPKGVAFDLYGGVGFFALPLAELFERVVTVESGDDAVRYARRNLEACSGARVVMRSVEDFLRDTRDRPDFVLVDPPRAGLSSRVRAELRRLAPKHIAYLSCDPVTLSRDVAELVGHGWSLRTLDLVDLFPNTHHVETLASLVIAD
jgi:23S rRNA (uracil1939-C5)-methyltransferase